MYDDITMYMTAFVYVQYTYHISQCSIHKMLLSKYIYIYMYLFLSLSHTYAHAMKYHCERAKKKPPTINNITTMYVYECKMYIYVHIIT